MFVCLCVLGGFVLFVLIFRLSPEASLHFIFYNFGSRSWFGIFSKKRSNILSISRAIFGCGRKSPSHEDKRRQVMDPASAVST